eukprot:GHRR01006007.1.p1 GENE.GHRR01006007.1~~GHRR01006007.1.p1  ORF type:complete len:134 (+),score=38.05 GHRR01006007.1:894-1295(+)
MQEHEHRLTATAAACVAISTHTNPHSLQYLQCTPAVVHACRLPQVDGQPRRTSSSDHACVGASTTSRQNSRSNRHNRQETGKDWLWLCHLLTVGTDESSHGQHLALNSHSRSETRYGTTARAAYDCPTAATRA